MKPCRIDSIRGWVLMSLLVAVMFFVACRTASVPERRFVEHSEVLRRELLGMRERDQKVREGFSSKMSEETMAAIMAVDGEHLGRLKEIVRQFGWPGKSLVGADGAEAAWLLVQHAPTPFMKECLPLLEDAVSAGESQARHYAYLYDRVQVQDGNLQKYGTQYRFNPEGGLEREPLADPESVDQRRAAIGLSTMEEYEAVLKETYQ